MAARVSRQHRQSCRTCRSGVRLARYKCRMLRTLPKNTGSATCATCQRPFTSVPCCCNTATVSGWATSAAPTQNALCGGALAAAGISRSHNEDFLQDSLSLPAVMHPNARGICWHRMRHRVEGGADCGTCKRQPWGAEASAPRLHSTYSLRRHSCEKREAPETSGCRRSACRCVPSSTMATRRSTHSYGV